MSIAYRLACNLVLGLAAMLVAGGTVASVARYVVSADEPLRQFVVNACFPDDVPDALEAYDPGARQYLSDMTSGTGGARRPLRPQGERVSLLGLTPGSCVRYTVAFDAVRPVHGHRAVFGIETDVLFSPNL